MDQRTRAAGARLDAALAGVVVGAVIAGLVGAFRYSVTVGATTYQGFPEPLATLERLTPLPLEAAVAGTVFLGTLLSSVAWTGFCETDRDSQSG